MERLAHPRSEGIGKTNDDVCTHLESLLDALEAVLHGGNKRRQTVATLLRLNPEEDHFLKRQTAIKEAQAEKMPDAIEVLFRRANAGGTPLEGEEMAFSLLKARWDGAYPLVDKVVQDEQVGYLLPPSGLVLAAARLALIEVPGSDGKRRQDVARPSVRDFRRWIGEPGAEANQDGSFLAAMKELLQPVADGEDSPAHFHAALARFCGLVLYRDADRDCGPHDRGSPRELLLSVNPLMLHPVLYWLNQRRKNDSVALEKSRLPLLRYLVFSLLGLLDAPSASLYAVEVLRGEYAVFPDRLIYQRWCEPGKDRNGRDRVVALTLPTPEQLAAPFAMPVDGLLRDWSELFGGNDESNPHREFRRRFWAEGPYWRHRALLLWFQRQYLPQWFKGYNPMREGSADKPYDEDHILATAHLIKQGATPSTPDLDEARQRDFNNRRGLYLNSLGNFRIWPLWANRADGKNCPDSKLRLIVDSSDSTPDEHRAALELKGDDTFLIASCIDPIDRQFWIDASDTPFEWPAERRKAWQTAVEHRMIWLYQTLYNTLGYSEWKVAIGQEEL